MPGKTTTADYFVYLAFGICISALSVFAYAFRNVPVVRGELVDSDCYMHLLRAEDFYETGDWHNRVIHRANAPYGHRMHWSIPFDAMLVLGALPLSLFLGFDSALFTWGVVISPLLMAVAFAFVPWSARPILQDERQGRLAGYILILQASVISSCVAARPDHHSLLVVTFFLSVGLTLRMIVGPFRPVVCYAAGAMSALAMWVSLESFVPVAVTVCVLGLLWVLRDEHFLRKNLHYSLALVAGIGLATLIEKPWHDFVIREYDRISIVHLGFFGFIALLWVVATGIAQMTGATRRRSARLAVGFAGVAGVALAMYMCFPGFYISPYARVDATVASVYLSTIGEIRPLMASSWVTPVQLLVAAAICLPLLARMCLVKVHDERWPGWFYLSVSFITLMFCAFHQLQWSVYPQVLLTIPLAHIIALVQGQGAIPGPLSILRKVVIPMVLIVGPLALGMTAEVFLNPKRLTAAGSGRSIIPICRYLSDTARSQDRPYRILTFIDLGAEILYRTPHEVVGTIYHTNDQGILDTHKIMTAETDEEAYELIQERGVDLILCFDDPVEASIYRKPGDVSTLYTRLCADETPSWCRKVELPADLGDFLLFEVARE